MRKKGLPPGYSERDIPGKPWSSKPRAVSEKISNMIHSLSELPSGKLPNKKKY